MTFVYILLALLLALYLWGCVLAYRIVMSDAEPETHWLEPTLWSWVTVLLSWIGPVQ